MLRRIINISCWLLLFVFPACIKEDLAECTYRLTFDFEPEGRSEDEPPFVVSVSNLSVFAFDSRGLFAGEFKAENPGQGSTLLIPLPKGKYTLVTWSGFTERQLAQANLVKGTTRLQDFFMPAYVVTSIGNSVPPEPLFYGIITDVMIDLPPAVLSQEVNLVQSTKPFRVRISGLDESQYQMILSHNAGRYNYRNMLGPPLTGQDSRTIEPMIKASSSPGGIVVKSDAVYSARTGVLWPVGLADRQITILDTGTGYPVINLSLSDLMDKIKEVDFDQEPAINMQINYRSAVEIDVNLNGWWIIYSDDEI